MKKFLSRYFCLYRIYHTLFYLCVISAIGELSYGVMNQSAIQPYLQSIGLTGQLGLIMATFLVVETLLKSPMGHLGDRFGRRPLIVGGALISCMTALGMTMARTVSTILPLRALDGVAAAAIWPTLIAAVGGSVPPEKRTSAMSALTVTYIAGVAIGPLIGGITNDRTGSKIASFYLVSALFLFTAIIAFFFTPHMSKEDSAAAHSSESHMKLGDFLISLKLIPDLIFLSFAAFFAVGLLMPIIKLFAMDELHLSETGYGAMIVPIALGVGLTSLAAGRVGDRWGKTLAVRVGISLTALGMWAAAFSHISWQFAIAGIVIGMGFVLAMPAWMALISDIAAPRVRGAVVGTLGTSQGIGAVIGAWLGAYLYATVGLTIFGMHITKQYLPFYISAVALTLCMIVGIASIKEHDTRRIGA